jgi:disulfide bond formation protein DsbB
MNVYLYQYIVATPILIIHGVLAVVAILALLGKLGGLRKHVKKHGMIYAVVVAVAAFAGSLGFSEGYAFAPCKLCWWQRIFHYPQLVLFIIALKNRDMRVWTYSLWLSIIGGVIATYQVAMQWVPSVAQTSRCSIVPAAESCSDILVQAYGYISIPTMSLTLFVCLIVLYLLRR